MHTRKNVKNLTAQEKKRLVDALLAVKKGGVYDEYVRIHHHYFVADGEPGKRFGHMAPSFFPWHRQMLISFENELRKVDDSVTLPYWDWTLDQGSGGTPPSPYTPDFLGGNGREGDHQVMDGPFAGRSGDWPITVQVTDDTFLMRDFGAFAGGVTLPSPADLEAAMADPVYDTYPYDSTISTRGFRNQAEGWTVGANVGWTLHNRVHAWVGGQMTGGTSPNDPTFWLHHAFIDLLWARWQKRHPAEPPYLPEQPIASGDPQYGRVVSLDERLEPWGVSPAQMLDHTRFYTYA
ncbi:tyrosinase family protein [Streptomyces sp. AC602_WCS936]|uniref:tyrosinase family protein n=1 Tax=Streptomyces sp. AC602_WCS936 TaxID=2823685 RepID=UPI001C25EC9E|nr:tyrosinase family protein [Streptomyces sp. AC602_WCS936]